MTEKDHLTPGKHKEQIEAYGRVRANYETYATTLERVLKNACNVSFPEAFIQSRAKTRSSFAEKIARKFDKYPDAVNQMTDLCGARVIVQTTEQVRAVRQFIEANFLIVEKEDKGLLLSEDRFGYRDMHYIVQLLPARYDALGITPDERQRIGDRRAEIQVRTWLQHAWADTLHDRIYKNKLMLSSDVTRTGNLLAALMEEGDRNFNQLSDELDGLIANYTAFAAKEEVKKEIDVQKLILGNEPDDAKKPALALKLARLMAASGDHAGVVEVLSPHANVSNANRCELMMALGHSLCKLHRKTPSASEYGRGRRFLEESLELCGCTEVPFVPHLRRRESLYARALARLGWALEPISGEEHSAREYYYQAHEHEPSNPYYLADMLGFEVFCTRASGQSATMRTTIRAAIKTCRQHAVAGIELPFAYFAAARLNVLLGKPVEALGCHARGIRHCLAGTYCVPSDILDIETEWLARFNFGKAIPREHQRIIDLLTLAKDLQSGRKPTLHATKDLKLTPPVLILAGGAAKMDDATLERIEPLVSTALTDYRGSVISGGTTAGVPGCAGQVTAELAAKNSKRFRLVGYIAPEMDSDAAKDTRYDQLIKTGQGTFSADQIRQNWTDILSNGVRPHDVMLLGFGGGEVCMIEYWIALALGANVGIVAGTGGSADALLSDALWSALPNLYPLPFDPSTIRAFVIPSEPNFEANVQEDMAQSFHGRYVINSAGRLPANMRPWEKLDQTFKKANLEQAKYSVEILKAAGFGVREATNPVVFGHKEFDDEEVEFMAKMEHGRWNVERLRDGWRYGKPRDDARKIHDCLVPWSELPDTIKPYDRDAVRAFPEILAKGGLEAFRRDENGGKSE